VSREPRICLFDWNVGGHHAENAKAFAAAIAPGAEVVMAAPERTLEAIGDPSLSTVPLGEGRPRPETSGADKAELAEAELDVIEEVVASVRPDQLVLLWADPVLRWLLARPPLPTEVSMFVAFAPLHYHRAYGVPRGVGGTARAVFKELSVLRWAQRKDARAIFALDSMAARRWSRYPGADVHPVGEAPLSYLPDRQPPELRRGCMLFGYLDERKGIGRIADAVSRDCEGLLLRLWGESAPGYEATLAAEIERMRSAGVEVDARLERVPYEEALDTMAASSAALLSFGWVSPGSRVLLEAAAAGTPAIGSIRGAAGYLIAKHDLGAAVDPSDTAGLRAAIRELGLGSAGAERLSGPLRKYAEAHDREHYGREIRGALGLDS